MATKVCKICGKERDKSHFPNGKSWCRIRPCPTYASKDEFALQSEFFRYVRANPLLADRIFAVPNGANMPTGVRSKMKKEGMTAGVWDIVGLIPNSTYSGFIMEFKTVKGRLTDSQKDWELKINPNNKPYFAKAVFISPKRAYEWVLEYVSS